MNQGIAGDIAAVMPELLVSGLLTSLCTIQTPSGNFGDSGAPDGNWVDLAGHVNIPCKAAPLGDKVQPTEIKELSEVMSKTPLHVTLGGYFPLILSEYRAVIDGVQYDIMGVESDSFQQMTTMAVRIATV